MRRRRRQRKETQTFSLSFLDAVSCGFGAIVILLVLTKIGEPRSLEQVREDLQGQIMRLEEELHLIRGDTDVFNRELTVRVEQLSEEKKRIARLRGDLSNIRGEFAGQQQLSEVQDILEGRLLAAQQTLTEEMKRLQEQQKDRPKPQEQLVGGIPVDSEYIIFIVDTSGSMYSYGWSAVIQKMKEVLDIYPKVKGIQVMNDMGQYMFSGYAGRWIPDTPGRRRAILTRLAGWNVFSNSSPVEGITRAIQAFGAADKKVSIYVFGDEFTGDSIQTVIDTVDAINPKDKNGKPRVRIHGVGFPVIFTHTRAPENTGIRFSILMRELCYRNGGTFVALNSINP